MLYKFERLIKKYSAVCQLITFTEGKWKAGKWVKGEPTTTEIKGTIVPISEKRIQNSGGSYKQGDCEFITLQPIELTSDTFLIYKDKKYKLQDTTDFSEYADFYTYVARGVSSFDTTREDTGNNT